MGCNCGGSKGKTIGQARKSGSTMPVGYSADFPLILGAVHTGELPRTADELAAMSPPAQPPIRIRVVKPAAGLRLGQASWVTGPGVQEHLDSGAFVDITRTPQKQRQWRVGAFAYTDYSKASRVAAAQGTKPVEIN